MMTANIEPECPKSGAKQYAELSRYTKGLALCVSLVAEDCA
jgi:hypothetical protein